MTQPVVCGVYCLFLHHELVYVGKSKDAYARISSHRTNGREFDYATVSACPEADMNWIESAMIKALETRGNRTGKPPPEPKPQTTVRFEPKPRDRPQRADDSAIGTKEAMDYVRDRYLSTTQLRADLKSGALVSYPQGDRRGPRSPKIILFGDLRKWCVERQASRIAGGPFSASPTVN